VATYEGERSNGERGLLNGTDPIEEGWEHHLRLGQDVRLVLTAVGGGAVRVAREVARRHVRHLETVAINCDPRVQGFDEFDHRVYLGPDSGADRDTGGSPFVGGLLARAAEPTLHRIFHGATFVVIIGSLGGGAGSGAFPHVLEIASRNAEVVSAFVIKPFRCEGDRRSIAERAIGRLHLLESFAEKRERGCATLQILDNQSLVPQFGHTAFTKVGLHWADLLQEHIENSFLAPAEAAIAAARVPQIARAVVISETPRLVAPPLEITPPAPLPAPEGPPVLPAASLGGDEAELTFEVVNELRPTPSP
jgi:hypothetical protein